MQVSQDEGTEEQALAHMERERVRCALVSLPPAQRQVIEFAYYGGLSCSAIARQLGEPLGTVTTRLRLKLLKLRKYLHSTE